MNAKPKAKLMIAVCKTGSILESLFAKVSGELVGSQHGHKLRIWWDLHTLREFFLREFYSLYQRRWYQKKIIKL